MARIPVAGVALSLLLVTGCATQSPGSLTGTSPGTRAPATPDASVTSSGDAGGRQVVAGPVALDVPPGWRARLVSPNPSGNVTFAFIGPGDLPSECEPAAQGTVCRPWPIEASMPGGIVIAVRLHGLPGSRPPTGGDPITVAGLPAERIAGPADAECQAIGGSELIDVVLSDVPGTAGWLSIDGCLAGLDTNAAEAAFGSITASLTFPADQP